MKKLIIPFLLFTLTALAGDIAIYISIDEHGNAEVRGVNGGASMQACVNTCRNRQNQDVDTCDDTTYFQDPRCSVCGGTDQPGPGGCIPINTDLDSLTECLYTSCLNDAYGNYRACFQACKALYRRLEETLK